MVIFVFLKVLDDTAPYVSPSKNWAGLKRSIGVINTAVTRGGKEVHSRGGGETSPQGPIPVKKKIQEKKHEGENRLGRGPKFPPWRATVLNLDF